jgi:hypothetical protein
MEAALQQDRSARFIRNRDRHGSGRNWRDGAPRPTSIA